MGRKSSRGRTQHNSGARATSSEQSAGPFAGGTAVDPSSAEPGGDVERNPAWDGDEDVAEIRDEQAQALARGYFGRRVRGSLRGNEA